MSIRSLTDFMEVSLGRCCGWQTPPPSPAEGHFWWMLSEGRGLLPATSGDFSWPPAGTSSGHQSGLSHGHGQTWDASWLTEASRRRSCHRDRVAMLPRRWELRMNDRKGKMPLRSLRCSACLEPQSAGFQPGEGTQRLLTLVARARFGSIYGFL